MDFQQIDTHIILIHTLKEILSGKLLKVQMQDDLVFHDNLSETIEKIHNSTFLGQNPSLERNFFKRDGWKLTKITFQ